ncbi:RidA family protein [Haloferax denitrificans]|uniref:RidA family protein n=1 Tax=Haloferax denitrificans TaxID=35745 RepID=UPI003C6EDD28
MKRIPDTDETPAAVSAYSRATTNGSILVTAGQSLHIPDGELLGDDPAEEQTRRCLQNVEASAAAE